MKSKTYYQLIVDASGSMSNVREQTLNALNDQIRTIQGLQSELPEQEILVSLCFFNTETSAVFTHLRPGQAPQLEWSQYMTNGSTALLDALGACIHQTEKIISPIDDVVMVVLTDGEENASQFYTFRQVADMVSRLKKTERWTFSFLGADFDSWSVARRLNIDRDEVRSYDKRNMNLAMEDVSTAMSEFLYMKEAGHRKKGLFKKQDESGK